MLEVIPAKRMSEGQGVSVNRLFPISGERMNHDPFVLFDHFEIPAGKGFSTHPHRGFEAITYLFSGAMRHKDNLGNDSVITQGGAQIFCAGRGIEHSEMPEDNGTTSGIQLWINLPKVLKHIDPSYQSVDAIDLPIVTSNGVTTTTIAGRTSAVKLQNQICYQSVQMTQGSEYKLNVEGQQGIVYVVKGALGCNQEFIDQRQSLLFDDLNKTLVLKAQSDCHLMVLHGKPHNESIRQYGPFVD